MVKQNIKFWSTPFKGHVFVVGRDTGDIGIQTGESQGLAQPNEITRRW